jgi:hypothetical protein
LNRPALNSATRAEIELQIRKIHVGAAGENDAAHYLRVQFADSKNWVVLNDVRIEVGGAVAQIDHLLISRLLDVWLCESKAFTNGIKINEFGEFLTFYNRVPVGVPSPIEQNLRHMKVMERLVSSGAINLPKRLGFSIPLKFRPLVLVAKGAIHRPKAPIKGLETIIKADQVATTIERLGEQGNPLEIAKLVGQETLHDLGQQLLSLHRPITIDWAARFGLSPEMPPINLPNAALPHLKLVDSEHSTKLDQPIQAGTSCQSCNGKITDAERQYCLDRPKRFNGQQLCMKCQRSQRKPSS